MKKRISFSLIYCLFAIVTYAQNIDYETSHDYFSYTDKYEFNLPQFDFSIPLPANASFRTPLRSGKNVFLEIGEQTNYYFDLGYLRTRPNFLFEFILPDNMNTSSLIMTILPNPHKYSYEEYHKALIPPSLKSEAIPSLKTKIGNTFSRRILPTDTIFNNGTAYEIFDYVHFIHVDDYLFVFSISSLSDAKDIKRYENIIKKATRKNLSHDRIKYETRVKNNYFDKKEKEEITEEKKKLTDIEGQLNKPTTFCWEQIGFNIKIPTNWHYEVNGRKLNWISDNTADVSVEGTDMHDHTMMFNWFKSEEQSMLIRFFFDETDLDKLVETQTKTVNYSKAAKLSIDGKSVPVVMHGSEEVGTLEIYFKENNISYWISIYNITKENILSLDEMLSSIKINKAEKGNEPYTPVSNIFKMKDLSPIELNPPINLPETDLSEAEEYIINPLDMKLYLSGNKEDIMYSKGSKHLKLDGNEINELPDNDTDKRLSVFFIKDIYAPSYSISKYSTYIPVEKYIKDMKRTWKNYKNQKIIHASVMNIDGRDWGIFMSESSGIYMGIIICYFDKYQLMITYRANSEEEVKEKISVINTVEFIK